MFNRMRTRKSSKGNKGKEKQGRQMLSTLLASVMAITLFTGIPAGSMESVQAATTLSNPRTGSDGVVTWDCVYFGSYPQSDATGQTKDPIKWRVLSVDGNDAFLVADTNLDAQGYNDTMVDVTWETCTMRSWLNGYGSDSNVCSKDYSSNNFIDRAFTASEQNAIKTTAVVNADNLTYGITGGNSTQDKIFLLSYDEVTNPAYGFSSDYSTSDNARKRINTAYVAKGGTAGFNYMNSEGSTSWWWLRSPGDKLNRAMYVNFFGAVHQYGDFVSYDYCVVCPALHLDLSFSNLWSYAGTVSSDGGSTEGDNPPSGGGEEPADSKTVLQLSEESMEIVKGEKVDVSVDISNSNHDKLTEQVRKIKYESADDTIARVDNSGLYTDPEQGVTSVKRKFRIEAVAYGETDIIFSSPDGDSVTCHVTVIPSDKQVSKIKISAISKKLAAGKKVKLSVSITPDNASNKTLTWTSSNPKYATVDSNGRVSLKKKGAGKTVTITATAKDGSNIKAAYKIKIMKHAVKSIRLKAKSTSIKAGKSITIKPTIKTTGKKANKTLKWTSSNTKYATVSKKGKVKTKKAGKGKKVKITAMATDGSNKKATIKIKIK
ncbi:MAG: Ig-like domain-containing protein [Lachnospiraceae bacterium]|nr:Ig-like domain-containing protein [Lachnospiraceae bacterium]